uniref:Uncharacterized protein n=1 Tax=Siphoviridae sp. ctX5W26 TaxID=2825540 RepID=A0A8S5UEW1_9CAUD|nr:MAG TPA: hypothetical protein [Siphoviridae sp. ctX5W26]
MICNRRYRTPVRYQQPSNLLDYIITDLCIR